MRCYSFWYRVIFSCDSSLPPILGCDVLIQWTCLAFLRIKVFAIRPIWNSVVVPEHSSSSKLWKQKLDDVFERLRKEGVGLLAVKIRSYHSWARLTILNPSMSASSIHAWNPSATCAGVPTNIGPLPPTLTCSATVCFVHLDVPGENLA